MRRILYLALSVAVAAACGGPPFRSREKPATQVATADSTVLVAMDDDIRWALELIDHREQLLPDGRFRAQIRFANRSSKDLETQVSWSFKDDAGFPTEKETPFEHVLIAGGQTVSLTRESLIAGATAFHVQVRTAKIAGK